MSTPQVPENLVAPAVPAAPVSTSPVSMARSLTGRLWVAALLGAIVSGVGSWGIGELASPYLPLELEQSPGLSGPTPEMLAARARNELTRNRNDTIQYGVIGALLGLSMGVAGGMVVRSTRLAALVGVMGLVVGGAIGAGATAGVLYWRTIHPIRDPSDLVQSSMTMAGIWGPIGLLGGLALGLGLGRKGGVLGPGLSGCVGALLASGFQPVASSIFQISKPSINLFGATAGDRLVSVLLLTIFTALAATRSATAQPRTKPISPSPVA